MTNTTVLLADDDDDFRRGMRRVLVQHGYDVLEASDGAQALELLAAAADGLTAQPDVVVLDVMMPGCSGLGILAATRRFAHRPSTLLLTGFTDPSLEVLARRYGAARVLHKPVDLDEVLDAVLEGAKTSRAG